MLHEFTFPSYNERDKVQAWIYVPATDPVGIVQLVHAFPPLFPHDRGLSGSRLHRRCR